MAKARAPLEESLVPQVVALLANEPQPLHHLAIKAKLKLPGETEPAVVWRACKNAEGMGLIESDELGHFYLKEAP